MHEHEHAHEHAPHHPHPHRHGHAHDQGVAGALRYLRLLPSMWRSPVSTEVVSAIAPQAGERVVDLGAGMGAATAEALLTGASVVAVDPTPLMRAILHLRRWWPGRRNLVVLAGAAESMPLTDGSVDALWSVNTIHHWTDKTSAARELARVVRSGGRVLLVDEDMEDPAHPWHERTRAKRKPHFDDVNIEALAAELTAAGFSSATGARSTFAGRPSKVIRAVR